MSKLLEQAIARVRELSEEEQDAADALFAHVGQGPPEISLTLEQVEDVQRIQQELREDRMQRERLRNQGGVERIVDGALVEPAKPLRPIKGVFTQMLRQLKPPTDSVQVFGFLGVADDGATAERRLNTVAEVLNEDVE
jgi:hypothetical protein